MEYIYGDRKGRRNATTTNYPPVTVLSNMAGIPVYLNEEGYCTERIG